MEQTGEAGSSEEQQQRRLKLPCMDLINDQNDYSNFCVPLYEACMECDWQAAKPILDLRQELVRYGITQNGDTPLHVVAGLDRRSKHVEIFGQNLLNLMKKDDLVLQNKDGRTALHLAAAAGNVSLVKMLLGNKDNPSAQEQQQQQQHEVVIPVTSSTNDEERPPQPNLPCMDLIKDQKDYFNICVPLYKACMKGDWTAAKVIFDLHPELVKYGITQHGDTPLHIVAGSDRKGKQMEIFARNLPGLMETNDLAQLHFKTEIPAPTSFWRRLLETLYWLRCWCKITRSC